LAGLSASPIRPSLCFHIFAVEIQTNKDMKTSGLDVHKDSIFCAIYDGKSYSAVKEFTTTTDSIRSLGEYLKSEGVTKVAMESTSTYWIPVWDILYEMEFEMTLVNPLHIKQMPGRKSDAKDAQWIAELLHKNLLRGSLVPSPLIQELRTCTCEYRNLVNQWTKVLTQMDRILVMCGIRLSSRISNIDFKSFMQVVGVHFKMSHKLTTFVINIKHFIMTKEEYLTLAASRYESLEKLQEHDNFYDYEKNFDAIWTDLGRLYMESRLNETSKTKDRRKKKL
jgi:hypothetical protein